jgi:O-antigen/teichoic acid export membrane protein
MLMMQMAAAVLSYGSQILLARWMGPFEFGIYAVAWSLVLPTAAMAAIGLPSAAVRFIPQYLSGQHRDQLHGLIRHSIVVVILVGMASVAVGWLILSLVAPWLEDSYAGPLRVAILCVPFLTLIMLMSDMSRGFGWAILAFAPQWLIMPGLTILGVVVFKLYVGPPTAWSVIAIAAGASAVTAIIHLVSFRTGVSHDIRNTTPQYQTRLWLRVAIPMLLSDGVILLLWSSDEVMLGAMTSPEDVGVFHACVKTAGLTLIVFNAVSAFAVPRFAAKWLDDDKRELQDFARSIARWMFFPSLVIALGLIVLGPFLLGNFGDSFVRGYLVLIVLTLGYLMKAATGPVGAYLAVTGNQDSIVLVTAVSAIGNIALNAVLIPPFGVMGATVASIMAVLMCQIWQYLLVRRRLGINSMFLSRR